MISKCAKLWSLSAGEFCLLLQAMLLLPALAFALRCMGLHGVRSVLLRCVPTNCEAGEIDLAEAKTVARMVRIAACHGFLPAKCLVQSLSLWFLLRRRGTPCALRIGVRKVGCRFEAHAWVECAGTALNDHDDLRSAYAPFEQLILPEGVAA
jgi:hypothetical protein